MGLKAKAKPKFVPSARYNRSRSVRLFRRRWSRSNSRRSSPATRYAHLEVQRRNNNTDRINRRWPPAVAAAGAATAASTVAAVNAALDAAAAATTGPPPPPPVAVLTNQQLAWVWMYLL
jgi:hypothetical protein